MSDMPIKSIERVAALLKDRQRAYVPWVGAGVSKEAGIPLASEVCDSISKELFNLDGSVDNFDEYKKSAYYLRDRSTEYSSSLSARYESKRHRINYFRSVASGKKPAFGHYGIALLSDMRVFDSNIITTNFDKLIEMAFFDLGLSECQPIRSSSEVRYMDEERFHCLKIHGDYDTQNILNTVDEVATLDPSMKSALRQVLYRRGLFVIGASGVEPSVYSWLNEVEYPSDERLLEYGVLWGVYIGKNIGPDWKEIIESELDKGQIGANIVSLVKRSHRHNQASGFFPVFGSGSTMQKIIELIGTEKEIERAFPYLDHNLRIKMKLSRAGLSSAVDKYIESLNLINENSTKSIGGLYKSRSIEFQGELNNGVGLKLVYGSIGDTSLLAGFKIDGRAAVLTSEDTHLTVGGGSSSTVAEASGMREMLNQVWGLSPISLGDVAVTSAGKLPLNYVMHCAVSEIKANGNVESDGEAIYSCIGRVCELCTALNVKQIFLPLLGTGTAGVDPTGSLSQVLRALRDNKETTLQDVVFVVYSYNKMSVSDFTERLKGINSQLPDKRGQ